MEILQNKIKLLRKKLQDLRFDKAFQSLPKDEKEIFYSSLKLLNEFEDTLIINYINKSPIKAI